MELTKSKFALRGGAPSPARALVLAALALLAVADSASARQLFGPAGAADIPRERLFDLGVADQNGDGALDIFTTNHKFHSGLLRNDGLGNFTDVTGSSGFGPVPDFPGYENLRPPVMDRTGAYVYATDAKREKLPGVLHIRAVNTPLSGSVSFAADGVSVARIEGGIVKEGRSASGQPEVSFRLDPGAALDLRPTHLDLPISVTIDAPPGNGLPPPLEVKPPPPDVFVGEAAVRAPLQFILSLRDRHGYAFADVAGDASTDVFSATGGLGGAIKLPGYVGKVQDELLVGGGGRFSDQSMGSGLAKGTCRGRQVAAVPINGDNLLDLFESCEDEPPNVYLQTSRGRFTAIAPPPSVAATYRWAPLRRGGDMSLLAAQRAGTRIYSYSKGAWRLEGKVRDNARNGEVVQYALNDIDNDGDLDVLAVAGSGNTLMLNRRGELTRVPLAGTGIPSSSVAASFVDFDNDGRIDLDLIPQGLLRGVGELRFRSTGRLRTPAAGAGITAWPDTDNDGLRDPILVTGNSEFAKRMNVLRARNLGPGGHWLEVNLQGAAGNREAIGARVSLRSGNRRLYGWVGQSDDSHHSQGHYRIYFGLGRHPQVKSLTVNWPDGARTRLGTFPADRVVDIGHP